jgi:general secretion pathway protein D
MTGITTRRTHQSEGASEAYVPEEASPTGGAAPPAKGPGADAIAKAAALNGRQEQLNANLKADAPAADAQAAPQVASGGGGDTNVGTSQFSINPQAGIITVFATQRQHKAIARYLHDVLDSTNQQVLIEAKIMEITLNDQYRAGINWSALLGPCDSRTAGFNPATACNGGAKIVTDFTRNVTTSDLPDPTLKITGSNAANTLQYAAQMIKQFGTVRSLSNPRLTVQNNQTAVLKVAQNQVFFQLTVSTTDATATTAGRTTVNSQIKTVPVGLVMTVQPAVDAVTRKIALNLRPSITRITGFVQDPGVQLTIAQFNQVNPSFAQNITSQVPVIEAREIDSMVTLDSGDVIVMGGLMQDSSQNTREGLPGLMDVPVLGQAVSSNIKQNSVSELVIFIRATLVDDRGSVSDEDIRLYKTFMSDPRPVTF